MVHYIERAIQNGLTLFPIKQYHSLYYVAIRGLYLVQKFRVEISLIQKVILRLPILGFYIQMKKSRTDPPSSIHFVVKVAQKKKNGMSKFMNLFNKNKQ